MPPIQALGVLQQDDDTDPALEEFPALQKQLLRTGPDNLRRIKQQAGMLREGLLAQ